MMEVYWGSGSPYSWRVLLALETKGLAYSSKLLEFSKRMHKRPAFLELNPRGKVPVLVDGDVVLYESLAILDYLEQVAPDPHLFGNSPKHRAAIWQQVFELENYLVPKVQKLTTAAFFGIDADSPKVGAWIEAVTTELADLDKRLEYRMWLAGNQLSAADIVLLPHLQTLLRAAGKDKVAGLAEAVTPLHHHFPSLQSWVHQMEALPFYDSTYPPHWRD